jgi:hypothetical protein
LGSALVIERLITVGELARNTGIGEAKMQRILRDFEASGIAELVGDGWRLTEAGIADYCVPLTELRAGNVPLEPGDDDGLGHCPPGPPPAAKADRRIQTA